MKKANKLLEKETFLEKNLLHVNKKYIFLSHKRVRRVPYIT